MFEIIGIAGIAIAVLAYLPQAVHLAREHCSAGVSERAWGMWLVSSLFVGALALHRADPVFILLQLSTLTSATVILVLARRYRGMTCPTHAPLADGRPVHPPAVNGRGQMRVNTHWRPAPGAGESGRRQSGRDPHRKERR
ncbi:MAG: PQ-loop domain-containing transporter [Solirubrobacterales bacterium]